MHGLLWALRAEWVLCRLGPTLLKAEPNRKQDPSVAYELEACTSVSGPARYLCSLISMLTWVAQHTQVVTHRKPGLPPHFPQIPLPHRPAGCPLEARSGGARRSRQLGNGEADSPLEGRNHTSMHVGPSS
jgi:hypothetical protein